MTVSDILESTSFSTLNEDAKQGVRQLFAERNNSTHQFTLIPADISKKRHILAQSLAIHQERVARTNPVIFKFLNNTQQAVLLQDLLFSFYILSAQYQLNEAEHRRQDLPQLACQIKRCANLIDYLSDCDKAKTNKAVAQLKRCLEHSEMSVKYLGLTQIGPFIADKIRGFSSGKTVVIKAWMDDINERRMYWVWGGGMLDCVFSLLPDSYANTPQAREALAAPAPYLGCTSWLLYYARFGINLSLLLKHTLKGPWMGAEEKNIPTSERLKAQWNQRKFSLLNDSVWATVNLATYFWLNGRGMLGYWGDAITVGLLMVDASLTLWRVLEERTKHNENIARYEKDIKQLEDKIASCPDTTDKLTLELKSILFDKKNVEMEWKYQKYHLIKDLAYAITLFVAFIVAVTFLIPPGAILPATAMWINLTGAAICFYLTLAEVALSGFIDIIKIQETINTVQIEHDDRLREFNTETNLSEKKQLFLMIMQLKADSSHQSQLAFFQKATLARSVLMDGLIPPLVSLSLLFLPLSSSVSLLAMGFAFLWVSKTMVDQLKPSSDPLVFDFDEEGFEREFNVFNGSGGRKNSFFFRTQDNPDSNISSTCFPSNGK